MIISRKRKILIICLSLIMAIATVIFATHYISRNSYAQVNPDGLSAYDGELEEDEDDEEGEEGEAEGDDGEKDEDEEEPSETPSKPGHGSIVDPDPFDTPDGYDWSTAAQHVTLQIGKLVIRVEAWDPQGLDTKAFFNSNPDHMYDDHLDLVEIIDKLLKTDFIEYEITKIDGTVVSKEDAKKLPGGTTLFISVKVNAEYADSVEILYAEGVTKKYAYSIEFTGEEAASQIPVKQIVQTVFEFTYAGVPIDLQSVINEVLKDRDTYLQLAVGMSDELEQNGVGTFQFIICFRDGVKAYWEGTDYDRSAVTITVVIHPMLIELPTLGYLEGYLAEHYYTGYEIDVLELITALYSDQVIVASGYSTKATEAGEHTFNIIINPKYGDSIQWKDGVTGAITLKWIIHKSVISGDWGPMGDGYGMITITSTTDYELQSGDIVYIYTDLDGNEVDFEDLVVGNTYDVRVELKNSNLEWSEDPGSYRFTLEKKLTSLPKPKIDMESASYTGYAITFNITIGEWSIFDSQYADLIEIVTELSDSLTQTQAGTYKVVIRLKEGTVWEGNDIGNITVTFVINPFELSFTFDSAGGSVTSNYEGNTSSIYRQYFTDINGNVVSGRDLKKGTEYHSVIEILDTTNFTVKESGNYTIIKENDRILVIYSFVLEKDVIKVDLFTLSQLTFIYSAKAVTVSIVQLDKYNEYLSMGIITYFGSFTATNVGTYTITITLHATDEAIYVWSTGNDLELTLTFVINPAPLKGAWSKNGKLILENPDFAEFLIYEYRDEAGNLVAYEDLVDGRTYRVTVRIREGFEGNFDNQLQMEYTIDGFDRNSGTPDDGSGSKGGGTSSGLPWWVYLIIGLGALLLIILIIIIIIIIKRRDKDDDYDDFYDDEYYGDEEDGEGGDEDDYDDYDDYGDEEFGDFGDDNY